MTRAILLDRDGVLNRERPDYVKSWQEFEFLPCALHGLRRLTTLDCPILVISNQSAIGRKIVSQKTVDDIHRRLQHMASEQGGRIDGFFVCPHRPEDRCACRKPKPGLLLKAAAEFNLVLEDCTFVGDSATDFQAARAAGCRSILVETGIQGSELKSLLQGEPHLCVVADFSAAVSIILSGNDGNC